LVELATDVSKKKMIKDYFDGYELGDKFIIRPTRKCARHISQAIKKRGRSAAEDIENDFNLIRKEGISSLRNKKAMKNKTVILPSGKETPVYQIYTLTPGKKGRILYITANEEDLEPNSSEIEDSNQEKRHMIMLGFTYEKTSAWSNVIDGIRKNELQGQLEGETRKKDAEDEYVASIVLDPIPPLQPGDLRRALDFLESKMAIRPTEEQIEAISNEANDGKLPLFINGQAGTGKTCLLAFRISIRFRDADLVDGERFLVTAMHGNVVSLLKGHVGELLKVKEPFTKFNDFNAQMEDDIQQNWTEDGKFIFNSWANIMLDLLPGNKREKYCDSDDQIDTFRVVQWGAFKEYFQEIKEKGSLMTSEMAWYGIRTIIQGFAARYDDGVTPKSDFNKHENFLFSKESDIDLLYAYFEKYQKWKKKKNKFDMMDLAIDVYRSMEMNERPFEPFDEIYLDEAQDLTDVEFRILLNLLREERSDRMIFAGDPLQTINPTGFKWERIKDLMYESLLNKTGEKKSIKDPFVLTRNHRTPEPVVNVGNKFLKIRCHYEREFPVLQTSRLNGPKPSLLNMDVVPDDLFLKLLFDEETTDKRFNITMAVDEDELQGVLRDFHKPEFGLTLDELVKAARLESITDVKGDERNYVVMVNPSMVLEHKTGNHLVDLQPPNAIDKSAKIQLLFALNRLYIGSTRTSRDLFILDTAHMLNTYWGPLLGDLCVMKMEKKETIETVERIIQLGSKDYNPFKSAKKWYERYDATEEPHYLEWALNAIEKVDTDEQTSEVMQFHSKIKAIISEQKAREAEDKNKPASAYWVNSALHWEEFGHKEKAFTYRLRAKDWAAALNSKGLPNRSHVNEQLNLLKILVGTGTEGDFIIYKKLLTDKTLEDLNWVDQDVKTSLHRRASEYYIEEGSPWNNLVEYLCDIVSTSSSADEQILISLRAAKEYLETQEYDRLILVCRKDKLLISNNSVKQEAKQNILREILQIDTATDERISLREELVEILPQNHQDTDAERLELIADLLDKAYAIGVGELGPHIGENHGGLQFDKARKIWKNINEEEREHRSARNVIFTVLEIGFNSYEDWDAVSELEHSMFVLISKLNSIQRLKERIGNRQFGKIEKNRKNIVDSIEPTGNNKVNNGIEFMISNLTKIPQLRQILDPRYNAIEIFHQLLNEDFVERVYLHRNCETFIESYSKNSDEWTKFSELLAHRTVEDFQRGDLNLEQTAYKLFKLRNISTLPKDHIPESSTLQDLRAAFKLEQKVEVVEADNEKLENSAHVFESWGFNNRAVVLRKKLVKPAIDSFFEALEEWDPEQFRSALNRIIDEDLDEDLFCAKIEPYLQNGTQTNHLTKITGTNLRKFVEKNNWIQDSSYPLTKWWIAHSEHGDSYWNIYSNLMDVALFDCEELKRTIKQNVSNKITDMTNRDGGWKLQTLYGNTNQWVNNELIEEGNRAINCTRFVYLIEWLQTKPTVEQLDGWILSNGAAIPPSNAVRETKLRTVFKHASTICNVDEEAVKSALEYLVEL